LIDELWGERPPATALKSVQVYVSHLRKALGADVVITHGRGYLLAAEPDQVDLDRFAQHAAEGRRALEAGEHDRASKSLRGALALWRGPPLADFAYESFAQTEIGRVEGARLTGLEDRSEAGLAPGTAELTADSPVGVKPTDLSVGDGAVWVANSGDASVSQIDTQTHRVTATIAPGSAVDGMAAGVGAVWTSDVRRGRLARIDPAL